MARIYIARTTGIGSFERHVVLKMITPERANDATAVQMFLDEARLAASLNHQNVAQVFEVGEDGGIHYLAMEYVHGQDLRALLAKAGSQGTRVPLELALTVVAGAAAGLNHAHERRDGNGVPLGIVHRDVSPSNIMIGLDGSVKLLDFGIAKATQRSVETVSGIIKGKFAYMAPEQCRGRDVDRRSDVFSLGIILYEITTQHRCFRADSDFDTMHRIVTGDVVRPTRLVQGYPQALEAVVMKALAVDANQRYQSAGLLLEAIEAFAVSSRMSLSTMALGRFMRDMFGETPEPWMAAAGRPTELPPQPKESTISNTNGSSEPPVRPSTSTPTAFGEQTPPSVHPNAQAARTLLDLPPDHLEPDDRDEHVEWNAKSYPTMQPAYASAQTMQPDDLRPAGLAGISSTDMVPMSPPIPVGSQPLIPTPIAGNQFPAHPGSGSGPSHSAFPTTRSGYANAPGMSQTGLSQQSEFSYPRYEPPESSDPDIRLKPNRRPLMIGLCIVFVGIGIVLFVGLRGPTVNTHDTLKPTTGSDESAVDPDTAEPGVAPRIEGSAKDPATTDTTATAPTDGSAAEIIEPIEESISIKVVSKPPGANVLVFGKPIGTTPLDTKIPRGTGAATLIVQRAGYEEVQTKIDLTGDFSKEVELVKVPDVAPDTKKPDPKKPTGTTTTTDKKPTGTTTDKKPTGTTTDKKPTTTDKKPTGTTTDKKPTGTTTDKRPTGTTTDKKPTGTTTDKKPAKPPCQPPNQIDPFDTRPVCK
jgi:serine/threonine-protein kinase